MPRYRTALYGLSRFSRAIMLAQGCEHRLFDYEVPHNCDDGQKKQREYQDNPFKTN